MKTLDNVTMRWLEGNEIIEKVNPVLEDKGWALMNVNDQFPTCRVLGAFQGDRLVEIFAFQLYPILGPLVKIDDDFNDGGETSRALAQKMAEFLERANTRGCYAVADSPVTAKLCERFGMEVIDSPVYSFVRRRGYKE